MTLHLPKLSTLAGVVKTAPKPPLSLLRLGAMTTPMGAGIVAGTLVAGVAITHHEQIGSTLGKLGSGVSGVAHKAVSTTGNIISPKNSTTESSSNSSSMIFPFLAVGGLVVAFYLMKK